MIQKINDWFTQHEKQLCDLSFEIWGHPELSEQEDYAANCLIGILRENGFKIESNIAGLSTAFKAVWGSGSPRIGFLAEYDALPGLSQSVSTKKQPVEGQMLGHGCGHNLLGVGAVGAGIALKAALEENGLSGTVIVYGCPSEEIMVGKIVMAQHHVFDDLDIALSWHPSDMNCASEMSYQAMLSLDYEFNGKASHAAMAPHEGFSALDAVELMNVGANYLREHMPPGSQIHYVITNGGEKPNIVPEKAAVWYFIRARTTNDINRVKERLDKIAQGASLMTGASFSSSIRTGCNETKIVPEIVKLLHHVMENDVLPPNWNEDEKDFSRELMINMGLDMTSISFAFGEDVEKSPLHDGVLQPTGKVLPIMGSSDISDVSWIVPTGMLFIACYPKGTPNHTWGVTACSGMSIGQKGMLYASKILAIAGMHLVKSPELLDRIKLSYSSMMGSERYQHYKE
ncbi:MAG: amidohydrolase [Acetivibrionales bacterium]|jgi:aminobenzoyl-glutamate utilization protein B